MATSRRLIRIEDSEGKVVTFDSARFICAWDNPEGDGVLVALEGMQLKFDNVAMTVLIEALEPSPPAKPRP